MLEIVLNTCFCSDREVERVELAEAGAPPALRVVEMRHEGKG